MSCSSGQPALTTHSASTKKATIAQRRSIGGGRSQGSFRVPSSVVGIYGKFKPPSSYGGAGPVVSSRQTNLAPNTSLYLASGSDNDSSIIANATKVSYISHTKAGSFPQTFSVSPLDFPAGLAASAPTASRLSASCASNAVPPPPENLSAFTQPESYQHDLIETNEISSSVYVEKNVCSLKTSDTCGGGSSNTSSDSSSGGYGVDEGFDAIHQMRDTALNTSDFCSDISRIKSSFPGSKISTVTISSSSNNAGKCDSEGSSKEANPSRKDKTAPTEIDSCIHTSSNSSSSSRSIQLTSNSCGSKDKDKGKGKGSLFLDPSLVRKMRPHQLEAAQFLLTRLLTASEKVKLLGMQSQPYLHSQSQTNFSSSVDTNESFIVGDGVRSETTSNSSSSAYARKVGLTSSMVPTAKHTCAASECFTGAILADEVHTHMLRAEPLLLRRVLWV